MTQTDMILRYMKENGAITQWEAFKEIGCSRLPLRLVRISDPGKGGERRWTCKS